MTGLPPMHLLSPLWASFPFSVNSYSLVTLLSAPDLVLMTPLHSRPTFGHLRHIFMGMYGTPSPLTACLLSV